MAYPNQTQVQAAAQAGNVAQNVAYAYAAQFGYLPTASTALSVYLANTIIPWSRLMGANTDPNSVLAFITANGVLPGLGQFHLWMQQQGYETAQGGQTGTTPFPGQGYPPNNGTVNTDPTPTPTNTVPGPTQWQADQSGIGTAANSTVQTATTWWRSNEGKILAISGLGVAFYFGIPQKLLKSLGRRH